MKAYILGDIHLGVHPLHLDYWLDDVMMKYFKEVFIPYVEKTYEPGDIIIQLGDVFHDRTQLYTKVLQRGVELLNSFAKLAPTFIILGNHDLWNEGNRDIHSLCWAKGIKNLEIISQPKTMVFGNYKCFFMPYEHNKKIELEYLNNADADIAFTHSDLVGAKLNHTSIQKKGLNEEEVKGCKSIWSGHIHIRQQTKKFNFVGTPYEMDRGDYGNQKGFWTLDFETGESEFIPNELSPVYKMVEIKNAEDLNKLDESGKDRLDVVVSKELYFQDAKSRKKIDEIIREKKFEKIKWDDDLNLSEETDQEILENLQDVGALEVKDLVKKILDQKSKELDIGKDGKSLYKKTVEEMFRIYEEK